VSVLNYLNFRSLKNRITKAFFRISVDVLINALGKGSMLLSHG